MHLPYIAINQNYLIRFYRDVRLPSLVWFCALLSLNPLLSGQTACSDQHAGPGVFICYPEFSPAPGDRLVPEIFHLSAQANGKSGSPIRRYLVFLDGDLIFQNRLQPAQQNLSLELNLKATLASGKHSLRLVVDGAGTAELNNLQFFKPKNFGICDPIGGVQILSCTPSALSQPLSWKTSSDNVSRSLPTMWQRLYRRNLKNLEADIADAVAVDHEGNLVFATHSLGALELRKYAPNGSIIYDSVINTCRDPSLAISGLALDKSGHVWMAGNMSAACLPASSHVWRGKIGNASKEHGFIILLNTADTVRKEPVYATYLSEIEHHVSGIRVDSAGNAFVCGTTKSGLFPHEQAFTVGPDRNKYGFLSVMNSSGSQLLTSSLLEGASLDALALDDAGGTAYVTGSANGLLLAALDHGGARLSYWAHFQRPGGAAGRAISITPGQQFIFLQGLAPALSSKTGQTERTFFLSARPCQGSPPSAYFPPGDGNDTTFRVADQPALDAFSQVVRPEAIFSSGSITAEQTCLSRQ